MRAGDLLFVSAQAGVDPSTGKVPDGGIAAEAGSDLSRVVRITLFYTNLNHLPEINAAYAEAFASDPPARSAAIVGLAGGRSISIDAIAVA